MLDFVLAYHVEEFHSRLICPKILQSLIPNPCLYIKFTLLFFPFGEFLLALQQNAKVENDWCETPLSSLYPLITPKSPKNLECEGQ
ncbi:hypothetical protein BV372_19050 [Nostoc sp. T09]|nr:hypothetical protein BV372_19050 [Nostoc sp. T09]